MPFHVSELPGVSGSFVPKMSRRSGVSVPAMRSYLQVRSLLGRFMKWQAIRRQAEKRCSELLEEIRRAEGRE